MDGAKAMGAVEGTAGGAGWEAGDNTPAVTFAYFALNIHTHTNTHTHTHTHNTYTTNNASKKEQTPKKKESKRERK